MARFAADVTVYLDNEEAAIRLQSGWLTPTSSCQITEFQTLRETWRHRERATAANIGNVQGGPQAIKESLEIHAQTP